MSNILCQQCCKLWNFLLMLILIEDALAQKNLEATRQEQLFDKVFKKPESSTCIKIDTSSNANDLISSYSEYTSNSSSTSNSCPPNTSIQLSSPLDLSFRNQIGFLSPGGTSFFAVYAQVNLADLQSYYKNSNLSFALNEVHFQILLRNVTEACTPMVVETTLLYQDFDSVTGSFLLDNTSQKDQNFTHLYNVSVLNPGYYIIGGVMQLVLYDSFTSTKFLLRVSSTPQLLKYQFMPSIQVVTEGAEILSYLIIAVAVTVEMSLLVLTIKFKDTEVMKLSQGTFLIVFLITAIVASCGSLLFNPKSHVYCNLRGFFLFIPLQFFFGILCGRLWRITSIMTPLLSWGNSSNAANRRQREIDDETSNHYKWVWMRVMSGCHTCWEESKKTLKVPSRKKNSIKRKITNSQLWIFIIILTIPQVVLQLVMIFENPQELYITWNSIETIGRYSCRYTQNDTLEIMYVLSLCLLATLLVTCLIFAKKSSSLPSLFDEANAVYSSMLISTIVLLSGALASEVASHPESDPNISYLVLVFAINVLTVVPSWKIVVPKIKLIQSEKDITMHSILLEHRQLQKQKSQKLQQKQMAIMNEKRNIIQLIRDKYNHDTTKHEIVEETSSSSLNNNNGDIGEVSSNLLTLMFNTMKMLSKLNKRQMHGLVIEKEKWSELVQLLHELRDHLTDMDATQKEKSENEKDKDLEKNKSRIEQNNEFPREQVESEDDRDQVESGVEQAENNKGFA